MILNHLTTSKSFVDLKPLEQCLSIVLTDENERYKSMHKWLEDIDNPEIRAVDSDDVIFHSTAIIHPIESIDMKIVCASFVDSTLISYASC